MMTKLLMVMALLSVTGVQAKAQSVSEGQGPTVAQWPEVKRETKPGSRWWWMGSAVSDGSLQHNMADYARCGLGTLEITPIYGVLGNEANNLSYLSAPWMEALGTCQTAGDALGMDIDMNGGTGWPFGGPWVKMSEAAGKLVTKHKTDTSNGNTELTFDVTPPEGNAPLNKVMAYQQDGDGQVADLTAMVSGNQLSWKAPAGQWLLLAIYNGHTGQQVKRAAPGGEGLVLDHYDAEAVKSYLDHIEQRFEATGTRWPHTFFNDSYEVYGADWTPKMFDEFEKYRGYKLEEHMDQLLSLGKRKDADNQVLADYRQTLSDMLLNNFTRQWTDWAHRHGATTRNQGHGSPGNLIDFYAAVDIPETESFGISDFGIRGLRKDPGFTSPNLSDIATLKYASSAAHITGKPLTSSETFTWLAEHFRVSLSQMKPDLDLMFIAGVNHIFFHGTTYSPQEAAWPGWKFYASVDMSPTNSIWRDAPALMQYATRCQSFLQLGQPDNDLLVYAPFCDAMHKNTGANSARLQLFDINTLSQKMPSVVTAAKNIEAAGLDCDFISDQLLLTTTCRDGLLVTAAGQCYKALVVPVSAHLPETTKTHLDQLAAMGATIVYGNTVAQLGLEGEAMRTDLGLRLIRRQHQAGHHYFVTNLSDKDVSGYCPLAVPFVHALLFNPMTGAISQADIRDGKVWLSLKSGESIILQTFTSQPDFGTQQVAADLPLCEMAGIAIDTKWTLSFTDSTYSATPLQTYVLDQPSTWEQLDAATATVMGTGIYETTVDVTPSLLQMANGGMLLDLGDVRESARVYINNVYAGCAWSAPFRLNVSGLLHEGANSLRIEVTNLPANRIRQMDVEGTKWRIFDDVNMLDIANGSNSQSGVTYEKWSLVPSGLASGVSLVPLRLQSSELTARLVRFANDGSDFFPVYQLATPSGLGISQLSMTDTDGKPFDGYTLDGNLLTVKGKATSFIVVRAVDASGAQSETYLTVQGAYEQIGVTDLTLDEAPACDWQVMTSPTAMNGFEGSYAWRRAPAKNASTEAWLDEGVLALSEKPCYYFYYPGYGMATTVDARLQILAQKGDIGLLSYLTGSAAKPPYVAADSLTMTAICADSLLSLPLSQRNSNCIYRTVQHYRPKAGASSVGAMLRQTPTTAPSPWYTLQGIPTTCPQRGLYIRNGKKIRVVR